MKNSKIIGAIHVFDMNSIPFNRGLEDVGGAIKDPLKKAELLEKTLNSYLEHDPGIPFDFVIINQGTDNRYTYALLSQLKRNGIKVIEASDKEWPGPYGSRNFVYRTFPNYDYYFETDSDNMVIQDGWLKLLMDKMKKNPKIGLLGAYMDRKGFQAPDTVKWITKGGNEVSPPIIQYNSGTFTLVPSNVYKGFDDHWGMKWINQGKNYYEYTAVMGELYFAFKVNQLGYINEDLLDEETDLIYSFLVPDSKFPNMTVGNVNEYPTKKFICPFFNTFLAILDPDKVKWIKERYKNCERIQ